MKAATAIRAYTEAMMKEIKEFKNACSDEEWQELGKQACAELSEEFDPA